MSARAEIPSVQALPQGLVTLADHEAHACTLLDANANAYFNGGAGDEVTLRANRIAWDDLRLRPRVLQSLAGGHTRLRLLGREWQHPILLAPVAYQQLAHTDGELATAHAAGALGAGMVLSCQSSTPLEDVARAVLAETSRGPLWFQLHVLPDRGFMHELVQRAEQAGFEALVLTVDAPTSGVRDREQRAGFSLPAGVRAVNLGAHAIPARRSGGGSSALFNGILRDAPTWDDVEWLRSHSRLPVLLKGVLHAQDAQQATRSGVAGIVVSNHGGRTLDTASATAHALPAIVQAVAGAMPVLVDGGIRRGTDVLKAIALGAQAVLIGRPVVHGLTNAGAVGVAHVIRLLRDELEAAMALCGCATLDRITPALLAGTTS